MQRDCDQCGETYEAKRKTSKYCKPLCRTRANRGAKQPDPAAVEARSLPIGDGLSTALQSKLDEAGRADSFLGQVAMMLATRIENGDNTGSAVAALARELRTTFVEATRDSSPTKSKLETYRDELADRRAGRNQA